MSKSIFLFIPEFIMHQRREGFRHVSMTATVTSAECIAWIIIISGSKNIPQTRGHQPYNGCRNVQTVWTFELFYSTVLRKLTTFWIPFPPITTLLFIVHSITAITIINMIMSQRPWLFDSNNPWSPHFTGSILIPKRPLLNPQLPHGIWSTTFSPFSNTLNIFCLFIFHHKTHVIL